MDESAAVREEQVVRWAEKEMKINHHLRITTST
jgi:hypothetical protein